MVNGEEKNTTGLTLRELVLEVRSDVKDLKSDFETRISKLERSKFLIQGAWSMLIVATSGVAGAAGLIIGVLGLAG